MTSERVVVGSLHFVDDVVLDEGLEVLPRAIDLGLFGRPQPGLIVGASLGLHNEIDPFTSVNLFHVGPVGIVASQRGVDLEFVGQLGEDLHLLGSVKLEGIRFLHGIRVVDKVFVGSNPAQGLRGARCVERCWFAFEKRDLRNSIMKYKIQ